jgi:hypothetical protein
MRKLSLFLLIAAVGLLGLMMAGAPLRRGRSPPATPAFDQYADRVALGDGYIDPNGDLHTVHDVHAFRYVHAIAQFTPSFTPSNTPTVTPTPIGPLSYPEGINPLTGLPYPDEASMRRRPLIVKVSNYPPIVRPQSGLSYADNVWEYEAEGGVTRFAAVFRSQSVDHVGSVRSGRLIDLELAPMYQALFAYSGSSDSDRQMLLAVPWRLAGLFAPSGR